MSTTNFNVRLDKDLRTQATQVFASYGLSPTQAIKLFFNQVVATNQIPLSFSYHAEKQATPKLLNAIAELERGETTTYDSLEDFVQAFEK